MKSTPTLQLDSVAPVTTDDVPSDVQPRAWPVALAGSDSGGSGLANIYYTTDGSEPTTSSSRYVSENKPLLNHDQQIKYFSVDHAGNAETVKTSAVLVVEPSKNKLSNAAVGGIIIGICVAFVILMVAVSIVRRRAHFNRAVKQARADGVEMSPAVVADLLAKDRASVVAEQGNRDEFMVVTVEGNNNNQQQTGDANTQQLASGRRISTIS
jgi:hypothetical protein